MVEIKKNTNKYDFDVLIHANQERILKKKTKKERNER